MFGSGFDLIIFDCDGTLVDSEELNCRASVLLLEEFGVAYSVRDYIDRFAGLTFSASIRAVSAETGVEFPDDMRGRYVEKVGELQKEGMAAVMGAHDVVRQAAKTHTVCVASNGERANVINSIQVTGLDEFFPDEHIFTRIQVEHAKPAPDLFLFAAAQMGRAPDRTLVIEDSISGVQAGVAAGMHVLGFTGTAHDPEKAESDLRNAGAHAIIDDLIHTLERLKS